MKTQILRLEIHDDTASIRDKIAWAKTGRILLAFPKRRPPKLSKLDFILIQRMVNRSGAQLAITTRDPEVVQAAGVLDIPVFHSIQAAQRSPWLVVNRRRRIFRPHPSELSKWVEYRNNHRKDSKRTIPKGLQYFLFTLGLAAFLTVILLFMPGALIEISPARASQSIDLTVYPQVGISAVLPGGQIPAAEIHTTVSGQMEAVATGKIVVRITGPGHAAAHQLDRDSVDVPAGTVFVTLDPQPVRFLTITGAALPAGPVKRRSAG